MRRLTKLKRKVRKTAATISQATISGMLGAPGKTSKKMTCASTPLMLLNHASSVASAAKATCGKLHKNKHAAIFCFCIIASHPEI